MTVSVYDDIRTALETRLSTTPSLPSVAWENLKFEPTTNTPYLKVRFIPTARRPAVRGLNPQYRYQGVFQLLLCFPEGQGPGPTQDLVDTLIDRFQTGDDYTFNGTTVTIEQSEQMGSYNNSPWYLTPINISWFSYS